MQTEDGSDLKAKIRALPHGPGVYLMKDRLGTVLYVGKAKDLKKRVSSYFVPSRRNQVAQPKVRAMISLIRDLETVEVRNESEALLLEGRLIKEYKPRYNTDFVDDKRFLMVRVDTGELPRFRLTRNRREDGSRYFGPFAHSGLLRQTLSELRKRFGILLADAQPMRLPDGDWQLYNDVRQEIFGHANQVSTEAYQQRVEAACTFLEGRSKEWLADLEAEMQEAARQKRFEKAAELRDLRLALSRTIKRNRTFVRRRAPDLPSDPKGEAVHLLGEALGMPKPPATMECFDISHISGTFAVASMVLFADGKPDNSRYRRFKIRSFIGNDDFRAMEEVVGRRYRRLHEEGKPFPDLIVIDGGAGQVSSALRAFLSSDLEPPMLIGLAKKRETIIFSDGRPPLNLAPNDIALQLLQRLRDEAHRFANRFNAELRSKKIRETILMDFEGLGPVRRKSLLDRFGNLERLKQASPEQLREVEGIGPKLAERLAEFLARAG